jgi:mRNA-degrading endonuclease YafQ of YafQ-DinJ toxin-antitoxin module
VPDAHQTLGFTSTFLADLVGPNFTAKERGRFVRALRLLDENERHPSLRVHQLAGDQAGVWSASASDELRMTFERAEGGRKIMLTCSRHYAH